MAEELTIRCASEVNSVCRDVLKVEDILVSTTDIAAAHMLKVTVESEDDSVWLTPETAKLLRKRLKQYLREVKG